MWICNQLPNFIEHKGQWKEHTHTHPHTHKADKHKLTTVRGAQIGKQLSVSIEF